MSILIWCVLGILALKVIWNFGIPYALMKKPVDPKTGKRGGISLSRNRDFFTPSCYGIVVVFKG